MERLLSFEKVYNGVIEVVGLFYFILYGLCWLFGIFLEWVEVFVGVVV